MSESKHTPGPWGIDGKINIWIMAGHLHVATVPRAHDGDWSEANAELIASAPDLLHALHECQSVLAMLVAPDAIKQTTVIGTYAAAVAAEALARTALAKAEGR